MYSFSSKMKKPLDLAGELYKGVLTMEAGK